MIRLFKKYRLLLFICTLCIAANFFAKAYLIKAQAERILYLQKLASATRLNVAKPGSDQYASNRQTADALSKLLSDVDGEHHMPRYADQISFLVEKNRLRLEKDLVFAAREDNIPFLTKYSSRFTVKGKYADLKKFLADIQNIRGLSYIDLLEISSSRPVKNSVSLSIGIHVYFKKGRA